MFKPVDQKLNFTKLEESILQHWEQNKIFEKTLAKTDSGEPYRFFDGPPFATGLPHYGHILASTIKDVVPRYQTMLGKHVKRRWGWDCHGLPIEEIVERELGISGKKQIEEIGIKKFNETCRKMVLKYAEEWGKMVRRIARWVEFDNSYKTMDRDYMESVWWAFKEICQKGLVYEGRKVLLYCPRCETPISNFEVAMDNSYKDVTEEAVTLKFKIKPGQKIGKFAVDDNTFLLAWTTTPWTLPGNVALAVGEEIDYALFKEGEGFYIAAVPTLKDRAAVNKFKGKDLVNLEYEPLYEVADVRKSDKAHRVYAADFVNTEEGTGIVHTAVVYGEDDYKLGVQIGLPVVPLLDEKGRFNDKAPELVRGLQFKESESAIKHDLEERGLLFERKSHTHSYPHCWRCASPLYYNAIPSWFINIQKIKSDLVRTNAESINWYPEHLKFGRYQNSVEQAPDWNISRNRYWGNPIPVWKCNKCGGNTVVGSVAELKKAVRGYQDNMDFHRPYIDEVVLTCEHCGGEARRITEIFDSWMEAASMPFAEYHYPFENKSEFEERFPAQFVAEYIAQTRAWFYVMHVISYILFGKVPFLNVVTTGTILAEDGSKMSKSKKNFPDPWKVIEKFGVDSLRFYLMNSPVMQADNLNFSERDLENANRKVIRILWNTYNYFVTYANNKSWEPDENFQFSISKLSNVLDKWIGIKTQELINDVTKYLNNYDMVRATRTIQDYIDGLSTWYLRRSRGRDDEEFFYTLRHCLLALAKTSAPFMPYISEEIYGNLNRRQEVISVHLVDWPKTRGLAAEETELLKQMDELREVVEQAHALRAQVGIKLRQPLSKITIKKGNLPDELMEILKDEANVKEVKYGEGMELDTELSQELKLEGLARELERQINQFRKESGLKIGETVSFYFSTTDNDVIEALKKIDQNKVYASKIEQGKAASANLRTEFSIDDRPITLEVQK